MNKQKYISSVSPLFERGICHRGLHNDEFTENGLKAFQNAKDHNLPFELDVHLTKDNDLIVCHDSDLIRTTGKPGIIEKMTVKEIKENYRLRDGEEVPTLKEVFDQTKEEVPIVVELKVWERNHKKLAARVKEELKSIQDRKNIVLISFDPRALTPFRHSGFMRQLLLVGKGKYKVLFVLRHLFEAIDIEYHALDQKKVIRYQKKHYVNCWTMEKDEDFLKYRDRFDTVTFQHMDTDFVISNMKK